MIEPPLDDFLKKYTITIIYLSIGKMQTFCGIILDMGFSSMICRYGSYGILFPLTVSKEIKIIEGIIAGITHITHMHGIQYPQIQAESLFAE